MRSSRAASTTSSSLSTSSAFCGMLSVSLTRSRAARLSQVRPLCRAALLGLVVAIACSSWLILCSGIVSTFALPSKPISSPQSCASQVLHSSLTPNIPVITTANHARLAGSYSKTLHSRGGTQIKKYSTPWPAPLPSVQACAMTVCDAQV